jgi:SdiA-regulated
VKRFIWLVLAGALSTTMLTASASAADTVTVTRLTLTSVWRPPSPDPTGLTWAPSLNRLIISDSEVDEIPTLWHHRNLFSVRLRGKVTDSRRVVKATREPEDVAWNERNHSLFVADDDQDKVFVFRAGADGKIGTLDDVAKTALATESFGSHDPEGLEFIPRSRTLVIVDASGKRVYKVRRGADHRFGTADDVVSSFGVAKLGLIGCEDAAYDRATHHLFIVSSAEEVIVETTRAGKLVQKIDVSSTGIRRASGIVFAPGSTHATRSTRHLYVTDRGTDNNINPNENDGRLFEFALVTSP